MTLSARALDQLLQITKAMIYSESSDSESISNLIRIVDLEAKLAQDEKALYQQYVRIMENYLGVKTTPLNITALWESDPPVAMRDNDMRKSVNKVRMLFVSSTMSLTTTDEP